MIGWLFILCFFLFWPKVATVEDTLLFVSSEKVAEVTEVISAASVAVERELVTVMGESDADEK